MRPPAERGACSPGGRASGFTIVEVLVAVALFAIVLLVVLVPITGLFGLTKRSTVQVTATGLAQQWVEQVKGQWQDGPTYTRACIAALPPEGVTISLQDKDVRGNNINAAYSVANCAAATPQPAPAPLRLITVTATVDTVESVLRVEVAQ